MGLAFYQIWRCQNTTPEVIDIILDKAITSVPATEKYEKVLDKN